MRGHVGTVGLVVPQPDHAEYRHKRHRRDQRAEPGIALRQRRGGGDEEAGDQGFEGEVEHGGAYALVGRGTPVGCVAARLKSQRLH